MRDKSGWIGRWDRGDMHVVTMAFGDSRKAWITLGRKLNASPLVLSGHPRGWPPMPPDTRDVPVFGGIARIEFFLDGRIVGESKES